MQTSMPMERDERNGRTRLDLECVELRRGFFETFRREMFELDIMIGSFFQTRAREKRR